MVTVHAWEFHCPECGFGDREVGHLTDPDDFYCVVCIEQDGRHVRLLRWAAVSVPDDQARLREDLAAD